MVIPRYHHPTRIDMVAYGKRAVFLELVIVLQLCLVYVNLPVEGFLLRGHGICVSFKCQHKRLPLPYQVLSTHSFFGTHGAAGATENNDVQQNQHCPITDEGPLKSVRQAVRVLNSVLHIMFSAGDVFGMYSSPSASVLAPTFTNKRGGASRADSRWALGRPGRRALESRDDRDTSEKSVAKEDIAEEGSEIQKFVSQRDLNSWDVWQGVDQNRHRHSEDERQRRQQRRRKKMTLSTRYTCGVSVANASRLEEYMGLPFDQYSLLDQSFISRVEKGKENPQGNVFRFMVPANELVGLHTVPIVDVRVDVDMSKRQLAITSISSRFVSRATDGTILGTQAVNVLTNNSLAFSTRIKWNRPATTKKYSERVQKGMPIADNLPRDVPYFPLGSPPYIEEESIATDEISRVSGGNFARLRKRIFSRARLVDDQVVQNATRFQSRDANTQLTDQDAEVQQKLSCRAHVEISVEVPPPFSLLPGLILRQGASLILSTLVGTLVNRFMELLIEDYQSWQDQESRVASAGGLIGYNPQRFDERTIEVSESDDDDNGSALLPEPEYMI